MINSDNAQKGTHATDLSQGKSTPKTQQISTNCHLLSKPETKRHSSDESNRWQL